MLKCHTYILLNCAEVHPFIEMFEGCVRQSDPSVSDEALEQIKEFHFAKWFETYVMQGSDNNMEQLKDLAQGPLRYYESHKGYFVNGYKFHTLAHGNGRATHNSGVCVKGSTYNADELDYYGLLEEIVEVEYHSRLGRCVVVLFRCRWFDPVHGVKKNRKHDLVDVKHKSKGCVNDPFILASQSIQVYYAPYPSATKDLKDWLAVVKTKPRDVYEVVPNPTGADGDDIEDAPDFFQENERLICTQNTTVDNETLPLADGSVLQEVDFDEDGCDDNDEEEEFEDDDEDSDDDDSEPNLSDHSSD